MNTPPWMAGQILVAIAIRRNVRAFVESLHFVALVGNDTRVVRQAVVDQILSQLFEADDVPCAIGQWHAMRGWPGRIGWWNCSSSFPGFKAGQ
ncbi:MAG: hypothetical protein KGI62_11230 [Xanthomonadaceae bacterium]|nr:hypothetical protein [Xanthomonadaceae bacterium]